MTLKPKILVERKPNRTDPIFYINSENIMEVEYKGYLFTAFSTGSVKMDCQYNDDLYITNESPVSHYRGCMLYQKGDKGTPLIDTVLTDSNLNDEEWIFNLQNWFGFDGRKIGSDELLAIDDIGSDWDDAYKYLSNEKNLDELIEYWDESK